MTEALEALALATADDSNFLATQVPWPTLQVMRAGGPLKNIPFMREVSYLIGTVDPQLLPDFVFGLPMMGWAQHEPTQMERVHKHQEPHVLLHI